MISSIVSRLVILLFGTLYPAYASYKAVRTKNVKEYVKWMMYWIVFAIFSSIETFTDVFLSFWFPFYYEIKIALLLWLLSPATKGSSILYRKFVHPMLSRREQDIDEYIAKAKEQGYHTVLNLGTKGVNYATTVIMQTAIKGGGGLVNQLRRSYSLSDLSSDNDVLPERSRTKALMGPPEDEVDEPQTTTDGRHLRSQGYSPRRSVSGSGRVEMYFPEVDVDVRQHPGPREPSSPFSHIRSSEDISSGYSSAEPLYAGHHPTKSEGLSASREPLVRTASVGGSTRSVRIKSTRGGAVAKRGGIAEDSDWCISHDSTDEEECFYDIPSLVPASALSVPTSAPPSITLHTSLTESIISLNNLQCAISSSLENLAKTMPVIENDTTDCDVSLSDECLISNSTVLEVGQINDVAKSTRSITETVTVGKSCDVNSVVSGGCEIQAIADCIVTNDDTCGSEILELPIDLILGLPVIEKSEPMSSVHDSNSGNIYMEMCESVENKINNSEGGGNDSTNDTCLNEEIKKEMLSTNKESCENELQVEHTNECEQNTEKMVSVAEISDSGTIDPKVTELVEGDSKEVHKPFEVGDKSVHLQIDVLTMPASEDKKVPVVAVFIEPADELASDKNSRTVDFVPFTNNAEKDTLFLHTCGPERKESTRIEQAAEPELETKQTSTEHLSVSEHMQGVLEEPCTSAELREQSGSQVSLRKEGRAGRYYKLPAPVPPGVDGTSDVPKAELELLDTSLIIDAKQDSPRVTEVTEDKAAEDNINKGMVPAPTDVASSLTVNEMDEQLESSGQAKVKEPTPSPRPVRKQTEDAIMARLVLQPGIVKNVDPLLEGENNRSEVFISKSKPKRKSSKRKYVESTVSRMFVMPHFTSLLPFWREASGSQKPSNSAESSRRNSSVSSSSVGDDSISRHSDVRKSPSPALLGPDCRKNRQGASVTFADGDGDHGETSSAHEVKGILKKPGSMRVRDLSQSPTRSRHPAPLADWED